MKFSFRAKGLHPTMNFFDETFCESKFVVAFTMANGLLSGIKTPVEVAWCEVGGDYQCGTTRLRMPAPSDVDKSWIAVTPRRMKSDIPRRVLEFDGTKGADLTWYEYLEEWIPSRARVAFWSDPDYDMPDDVSEYFPNYVIAKKNKYRLHNSNKWESGEHIPAVDGILNEDYARYCDSCASSGWHRFCAQTAAYRLAKHIALRRRVLQSAKENLRNGCNPKIPLALWDPFLNSTYTPQRRLLEKMELNSDRVVTGIYRSRHWASGWKSTEPYTFRVRSTARLEDDSDLARLEDHSDIYELIESIVGDGPDSGTLQSLTARRIRSDHTRRSGASI